MNNDTTSSSSNRLAKSMKGFRHPHYDCQYDADSLKLVVYVPGVTASGVDIVMRGPDLTITALKERFVRPNWSALQLERAQRDYLLRLRVGNGYDPAAMSAMIEDGVLTVSLRKREAVAAELIRAGMRERASLAEAV